MSLEVGLRLPPHLLDDDGRDWTRDDRPPAGRPFAELVSPHVGLVNDQPPNPAGTPHSGGSLLPFAAQEETVVSNIGARDAEAVQPDGNDPAGFSLDRGQAENLANHVRFRHRQIWNRLLADDNAGVPLLACR